MEVSAISVKSRAAGIVNSTVGALSPSSSSSAHAAATAAPLHYDSASFWDAVDNHFTGNLDYKRQIESAARAEAVSAREAAIAREFSAAEAAKARRWQETMSNTAYSRAIADLKRNGINPYAIGLFQQASTPNASLPTALAGSGYVGTSSGNGGRGVGDLMDWIETAYKEHQNTKRNAQNLLVSLLKLIG